MINVNKALKNNRVMKSLTGLSIDEFMLLVPMFANTLLISAKSHPRKRKIGGGQKGALPTTEHKLFLYPLQNSGNNNSGHTIFC